MRTIGIYDFRGGVQENTPPEQMAPNEVLAGTNLYYDGKLKKRVSWGNYCTDSDITDNTIRGMAVAYMNGAYRTVVAVDNATNTQFYYVTNATTITLIQDEDAANYTLTKDLDVEMVEFNNSIIAVDGTDKPTIIYYDGSAIIAKKLETYDSRSRTDDDWYAGQWDDGASPEFIDDTTHAQDSTVDNFAVLSSVTNNDGFYVAGVTPFTKIVITNCPDLNIADEPNDVEYAYYAGSGSWTTINPTTSPTWTAAEADQTIEFDIPLDGTTGELLWTKYGDVDTQEDPTGVTGGAKGRYIFRVRFTDTAGGSLGSADKLTISHEQYLTQIFEGDVPDVVTVHRDRIYLAVGNVFRWSPPGKAKGWNSQDIEYVIRGGDDIVAMESGGNFLAVIKKFGYYRWYGTTLENFTLRYGGDEGGLSTRGAASMGPGVVYLGIDGIRMLGPDGPSVRLSDGLNYTPADGDICVNWEGRVLISDTSADTLYWADPDTVRKDDMGEGRLSWWKWTGQNAEMMVYDVDKDGNRKVIIYDDDNGRLVINGTNGYDTDISDADTNITTTLQTKYISSGIPANMKRYLRVKPEMSNSGDYTFTILADNGVTTEATTLSSGTDSGHYYDYVSMPWEMDGYNVSFKLVNATSNSVEIYGFAVDVDRRVF